MANIPSYDWDTWLNGGRHELHQGRHFEKDPARFARVIRMEARRRGMKATVHGCGGKVSLQAYVPEDE